jgi:uncharacterized protein
MVFFLHLTFRMRLLSATIFCFLLFTQTHGQNKRLPNAILWRIEKTGIQTSYLFGTLHRICTDDFEMPQPVKKAIRNSSAFYFETIFTDSSEKKKKARFKTADTTLREKIGAKHYEALKSIFNSTFTISDKLLNGMDPSSAYVMLVTLGSCRSTSYEYEIHKLIDSSGKMINGLETKEEHSAVSKKLSPPTKSPIEHLKSAIDNYRKNEEQKTFITKLYLDRNITELYRTTAFAKNGKRRSEMKFLLDERNIKWISLIESAVDRQNTFFAFGASHLAGEYGIINLLQKKGYILTPIF